MFDMTIAQGLASQTVAWLLTYALHSTLFLGLAWLVSRRLAQRMPAFEEAVWRFALVAGLVTASLQLAAGREPLSGSWNLAPSPSARMHASVGAPGPSVAPLPRTVDARPAEAQPRFEAPAPAKSLSVSRPAILAGVWLAGALLLSTSWLLGHVRLRRRLRPRPRVIESPMVSLLNELRERAGLRQRVRLTCSSRLPVPVALGVRRPEICVPPRALAALAPEQQEGMLAHELAHLVRRDPFWLAFGRLLASALFFQPLNWVAVRRLRELSELLCDEWAVGRTGRPVSLARCLTEVAGWSVQPLSSLPVPGMADRPSNLARRIRRLLDDARSPQRRVHPAWLAAGMVVLVLAVAAAAPGVQAAVAGGEAQELAPMEAQGEDQGEDQEDPGEESGEELESLSDLDELEALEDEDLDDMDLDLDLDLDVDEVVPDELAEDLGDELERSLEGISDSSMQIAMDLDSAGMAAAMALAGEDFGEGISEKEAEEIARRHEEMAERISRQVEEQLEPKMEELEKQIEKHVSQFQNSEEMRQLERRAREIAERARPSDEEMARLHAEIEKLRAEGGLSEEDKRKIREDARRMAEQHRLTDKDRAEIDEIRRQAREMAQRSMRENQGEIDQMRRQILEETRAIREEVRRQLENDPQLRELRERRQKEREHLRERSREDRKQDRERAPRPPRPERNVRLHIAPEAQVEPAVAPMAQARVDVRVRPAVAPIATPSPTPAPRAEAPEPPGR
jgi:beta-lactamase regulating signal transducer with metallopeptidase domain